MPKKITILSIDGGGIRGILPGVILEYIEKKLSEKEKAEVRISDYFDLLAGTSTGGILTCMYITPDKDGRPKFSASEAVQLYLGNGEKIFSIPFFRKIFNWFGLFESKYPVKNIEHILHHKLKDTKLSDALKPCLITAYEIFQRKTVFFNKNDIVKGGETSNFYLRDIARSTSAAPTYFKPAKIHSIYKAPLYLIDGGMFANNPSMCAYAEARTMDFNKLLNDKGEYIKPNSTDMVMISIGTGSHGDSYPYPKAKKWGVVGWLKPIIDIMMSGNSETVHYELRQLFAATDPENIKNYFRLEPTVGTALNAMDKATKKNMHALKEAGKTYISNNIEMLDKIVDLLIKNK